MKYTKKVMENKLFKLAHGYFYLVIRYEKYVSRSIKSLLSQSYSFKIFIIDDFQKITLV